MKSELKMLALWFPFAFLIGGTAGAATLLTGSEGAGVVIGVCCSPDSAVYVSSLIRSGIIWSSR